MKLSVLFFSSKYFHAWNDWVLLMLTSCCATAAGLWAIAVTSWREFFSLCWTCWIVMVNWCGSKSSEMSPEENSPFYVYWQLFNSTFVCWWGLIELCRALCVMWAAGLNPHQGPIKHSHECVVLFVLSAVCPLCCIPPPSFHFDIIHY